MIMSFDVEADAAFVYLDGRVPPGGAPRSEICNLEIEGGAVILLFSPDDRLVGLEVLGASRLIAPDVLARAERT